MKKITTQTERIRFSFKIDPERIFEPQIEWFRNSLEEQINSGAKFSDGERMLVGCLMVKLVQVSENEFDLHEPDMNDPVEFVDSCNTTLMLLFIQKSVNDSVGLTEQMTFSPMNDSLIVCTGVQNNHFVMSRSLVDQSDTGWFVGCLDSTHDHQKTENLRRATVYSALAQFPGIAEFLCLPEGTVIAKQDHHLAVFFDEKRISFEKSTYLGMRYPG